MNKRDGYHSLKQLYTGAHTTIYRARRQLDDLPVILKMLQDPTPSPEQIDALHTEYRLLSGLDLPGVIHPYALEPEPAPWTLVLEDIGAATLHDLNLSGSLPIGSALRLMITITEIVEQLHQQRLLHGQLNPAHILLRRDTGQVQLIDFGFARDLTTSDAPPEPAIPLPHASLPYIAPEQTGHLNHPINQRTDLYSLGASFYELLTGQAPFLTSVPLELFHSHLARLPITPLQLCPGLPTPIAAIVLKLLAKEPAERYQTAYGLRADLETCWQQWDKYGTINLPVLGQQDTPDQFQLPVDFYGHESELDLLQTTFQRVCRGSSELVLLSGPVGSGKTALVTAWLTQQANVTGRVIWGTCHPLRQPQPYAALIDGFRRLLETLLSEREDLLAEWRTRLQTALGGQGQLLAEQLPELELIIGPQSSLGNPHGAEKQQRLRQLWQRLMRVFATLDHPLVLFLDDMQWLDRASLRLLQHLLTRDSPTEQPLVLFLIGTCRRNDLPINHPLNTTLRALMHQGIMVHEVALAPLNLESITHLVADALHCNDQQARPLAELVRTKTEGQPAFVGDFLQTLARNQVLTFDYTTRTWHYDLAAAQQQEMIANMVTLLNQRVQHLSGAVSDLLQLAACIGLQFDLPTLAMMLDRSLNHVALLLWQPLNDGLVLALDFDPAHSEAVPTELLTYPLSYQFAHEQIRQTAYQLQPASQRQQRHWQIGCLLLERYQLRSPTTLNTPDNPHFLTIIDHLNQGYPVGGSPPPTDDLTATDLATLNQQASRQANEQGDYAQALAYLLHSIHLLQQDDAALLEQYAAAAQLAYYAGDFVQAEYFVLQIHQQARSVLERVPAFEIQLQIAIAQHRLDHAIELLHVSLEHLGFPLPRNPNKLQLAQHILQTRLLLTGRRIEHLSDLPLMTDPTRQAVMRMLASVGPAAFAAAPEIFLLAVLLGVRLSLSAGLAVESSLFCASYGVSLIGLSGSASSTQQSYQFGQTALQMAQRFEQHPHYAGAAVRTVFLTHCLLNHWKAPLRESLPPLHDNYQFALAQSQAEPAAFSLHQACCFTFFAGGDLSRLDAEIAAANDTIRQQHQEMALSWNEMLHQVVQNLRGEHEPAHLLAGPIYDATSMEVRHIKHNDRNGLFLLGVQQLLLAYLFDYTHEAVAIADRTAAYLDAGVATYEYALYHFYDSLARLALYPAALQRDQRRLHKRVLANQRLLQQWARAAPANHQHKYDLVAAELARVQGDRGAAREHYDQAIRGAETHHFHNEAALAHELAGRFYLQQQQPSIAALYIQAAYDTYLHWGALAKVHYLQARYHDCLDRRSPTPPGAERAERDRDNTLALAPTSANSFDLVSVIRALQAISGDIVLSSLLSKVMRIVLETTGAARGLLLLHHDGQWRIEAEGSVGQTKIAVLQSMPIEADDYLLLPTSLINYVARTGQSVVLDNAIAEGPFTHDNYIIIHQTRSLLCMPLMRHQTIIGLLYLENNLTTGAFTDQRLEMLSLLFHQVTMSIENARLYSQMEEQVAHRTAELHRNQRLLLAVIDNSPMAIYVKDVQGRYLLVNTYLASTLDVEPRQLIGKVGYDLLPLDLAQEVREVDQLVIQSGQTIERETTTVTADQGEQTYWETRFPIYDTQGQIYGVGVISTNITAIKQTHDQLLQHEQSLSVLRERDRLARELHDGLGQVLGFVNTQAQATRRLLAKGNTVLADEYLQKLTTVAQETHEDVREFILGVKTQSSSRERFFGTLEEYLRQIEHRYGLQTQLFVHDAFDDQVLTPPVEVQLIRIIQEALTNVRKHAGVSAAQVSFDMRSPDQIEVTIADTGRGFQPERLQSNNGAHFGLRIMRERAAEIHGQLEIISAPGSGTRIVIQIPVELPPGGEIHAYYAGR